VHPLNKPATVRDVLEARNFVARAILDSTNALLAVAICGFSFWIQPDVAKHYGEIWSGVAVIATIGIGYKYLLIKPSQSLLKSEEACENAPYEEWS
jgi:hypothetical protein